MFPSLNGFTVFYSVGLARLAKLYGLSYSLNQLFLHLGHNLGVLIWTRHLNVSLTNFIFWEDLRHRNYPCFQACYWKWSFFCASSSTFAFSSENDLWSPETQWSPVLRGRSIKLLRSKLQGFWQSALCCTSEGVFVKDCWFEAIYVLARFFSNGICISYSSLGCFEIAPSLPCVVVLFSIAGAPLFCQQP